MTMTATATATTITAAAATTSTTTTTTTTTITVIATTIADATTVVPFISPAVIPYNCSLTVCKYLRISVCNQFAESGIAFYTLHLTLQICVNTENCVDSAPREIYICWSQECNSAPFSRKALELPIVTLSRAALVRAFVLGQFG